MKCYQCRKRFYPKRSFKTLIEEPLQLRCDGCDKRYPRLNHKTVLPIDGYLLFQYTIFGFQEPIKEEAFMDEELKIILIFLKKRRMNDLFLCIDELKIELFECFDQFNLCDIYLICLFPSKLMI